MTPVQWLREHDPDFGALRRAGRTAIVMPGLFAISTQVIGNPSVATFAAFGSFAMLLLVGFGGPMHERLQSQAALGVTGAVLVGLGSLAGQNPWIAAAAMAVVAFAVLFAGVVSSVLAGAAPALLLAFVLPVSSKAPIAQIPDRLAGWGLAAAASLLAVAVMWPAPQRDPLRDRAVLACRALSRRLHADVQYRRAMDDPVIGEAHMQGIVDANEAVAALHSAFLATPYRPTGLSTPARAVVRLVDEINWLNTVVVKTSPVHKHLAVTDTTLSVKSAAADVLATGAAVLSAAADLAELDAAVRRMRAALATMEQDATQSLPVPRVPANVVHAAAGGDRAVEIVSSLDPTFRMQELSFAVGQIAENIERTVLAERRTWWQRLTGEQPRGLPGTLAAAQERAAAHLERHSVWLQNSVRAAAALAVAIFVANRTGVQHSFWVVLGTLAVLRSNALNTGQNIVRAMVGTAVGVAAGAALLVGVGTNLVALWVILPVAILIAGVAPAAVSFAAGQAAFTLTLVILYNVIAPTGWRVGLVRVEDVAIGGAVSLAVGVLFWPRGAGAALGVALAEAYGDGARYLTRAVEYGVQRCSRAASDLPPGGVPSRESSAAAASSRRLDDTFRTYLAERGAKPMPMSGITALLTGVASVRLAADAVVDLWQRDGAADPGDRAAARAQLLAAAANVQSWFDGFAEALTGMGTVPSPAARDAAADGRLIEAVRRDLTAPDGNATATAVRIIWTGEHLDAVRRLEDALVGPARTAVDGGGLTRRTRVWWWREGPDLGRPRGA